MKAMPEQTPLEFEREKWLAEYQLRKREVAIKEQDESRSRWSSPLVLAVLAAATAGLGNAAAIWLNGIEQRKLETTKTEQARILEESKAEAARILEVIKTGNNADKAAVNLKFLLDAGLISDADRRKNIAGFLAGRPAGEGPALPSQASVGEPALTKFLENIFKDIQSGAPVTDPKQQETLTKLMQMMQMMQMNSDMQKAPDSRKPMPR